MRSALRKLSLFAAVMLLGAVGHGDEPTLRLGTNVWPGYEPLYLARDLGYLDERTVTLVEYLSASEVLRAFQNQSLDAAALTLDEVLMLVENEIPVQIFLVTDISHGADVIISKAQFTSFEQLVGKRVGVEGSALGAYVISRALEQHGLSLSDIEVVPLEVHEHESAYRDGRVDAVVTFEPVRSKLLAAGARELFTSREIPGEIVDVLVVHRDFLTRHPEILKHIATGWFKALDYLEDHPEDASKRMSERLSLSPAAVLASYAGLTLPDHGENLELLAGDSPRLLPVAERLLDFMLEQELLRARVRLNDLIAPE